LISRPPPLPLPLLLFSGRASLATSFANYKFLIIYGLLFSIVKLASFYYGVIMSAMSYYSIDGIAITTLTYTMTLSRPVERLSKKRPTASLLGPIAVASTLGVFLCAFIALVSSLLMMASHPDYVKWPAEYANTADWWTLSDNWEGTVLYAVMFNFLLSSAGIFSFGYLYRQPLYTNWTLLINLAILYVITAVILLGETTYLSDLWHIASRQFNKENSVSPVWDEYQKDGGETSPAMSFDFRLKLFILIMFFVSLAIFWQSQVMEGFIGDYIRQKYYVKKRIPPRY
jgi:magnesium-transporting ATPase (P-type)